MVISEITLDWLNCNQYKEKACDSGIEIFKRVFGERANTIDVLDYCIENHESNLELLNHANWLIVRCMSKEQCVKYAVFAAREVLPVFEKEYPNDDRPRKAIEAAENVLQNGFSDAAVSSADAAAWSARSAASSAAAAACSARSASSAVWSARSAVAAASSAADAARSSASDSAAASSAADVASEFALKIKILKYGIGLLRG